MSLSYSTSDIQRDAGKNHNFSYPHVFGALVKANPSGTECLLTGTVISIEYKNVMS